MISKWYKKLLNWLEHLTDEDPVQHCELYRDKGCSHVDGPLCDYPHCIMNDEYIKRKHNL